MTMRENDRARRERGAFVKTARHAWGCGLSAMVAMAGLPALSGCSGETGPGPSTTGGRTSATGGSVATGGASVSTGGATVGSGGTSVSAGGATGGNNSAGSSSGGTPGGSAGATGGSNPSGGSAGASTSSGGANGGTATNSGGTAGSGTVTGGSGGTNTAGATAGSAGKAAGSGGSSGGAAGGGGKANGGGGVGGSAAGSGGTGGTGTVSGDLWVSPTGLDTNPGTQASPLKTLQKAVLMVTPGKTIWMMQGTHSYNARVVIKSSSVNTSLDTDAVNPAVPGIVQNGTASMPIKILGVAGTRPIIDFKPQKDAAGSNTTTVQRARGIMMWAHYWHIGNLEIRNAADNCIHVAGSYNTFDNLSIHDCGDTGLQITVPEALGSDLSLGAYNKIINCDSYLNFDAVTNGENADGFAAKDRVGPGNEFRGCRAYRNADDGWDFFYSQSAITLDHNWAFDMRHPMSTGESDGNGFKLGGQRADMPANRADHKLSKCFAFHNPAVGFDLNNNTGNVSCTGCGAWGNATNFESGIQHTGDVTTNVTPARAIAVQRAADGTLPAITAVP